MEHRIILGGSEFLPFARSCVAKLKKLGLPYADQSFEVGGVSIKVRIEPGHEYIRIDGGGCVMPMESGIIESPCANYGAISENPINYTPGIFHNTNKTTAYNAAFTKTSTDGKTKTNPSKESAGQFSGVLTHSGRFKGAIPTSTKSVAFSPRKIPQVVEGVPILDGAGQPVMVDDEWDANLLRKKLTVAGCPASVFTGRCRLYVQAMYGAPLYKNGSNEKVIFYASISPNTFQYQPVLTITSHWADKTKPIPTSVDLTTSSGVWLDTATGKHWLFNYEGDTYFNVYPLIADSCGEAARKLLRTDSKVALNAEDKRHLEAYILSTCKPDGARVQKAAFSGQIAAGTSMGYGWHWNYSGTRADIVKNKTRAAVEEDHTAGRVLIMESTHQSLVITKTDVHAENPDDFQQTWEATLATVSGPSKWGVERGLFCIVAPWGEWLEKQTPFRLNSYSPTNMFEGSATFYVFYKGDALQLCTVNVSHTPSNYDPFAFTSSDPSELKITPVSGTIVANLHTDGGSGWIESMLDKRAYYTVVFTCGGTVSPELYTDRVEFGWRREYEGCTAYGAYVPDMYSQVSVPSSGDPYGFWYSSGAPIGPSWDYTWAQTFIGDEYNRGQTYGGYQPGRGIIRSEMKKKTYWGRAVIATPQWDAEAIYMMTPTWYQEDNTDCEWGYMTANITTTATPISDAGVPLSDPIHHSEWFDAWLQTTGSGGGPDPDTSFTEQTGDEKKLICRIGAVDASGEPYKTRLQVNLDAALHITAEDEVYCNFNTISGTTDGCPVLAWSKTPNKKPDSALIPPQGVDETDYAVLVGWV